MASIPVWRVMRPGNLDGENPICELPSKDCATAEAGATEAVQRLLDIATDAWNRADAEAFAANFASDGSFTNVVGRIFRGHEAFVKRHAEAFKTIYKGSHLRQTIARLRFIRPDVALLSVNVELSGCATSPPGLRAGADGILRARRQIVLCKERGEWWIVDYHNVAVAP